MSEQARTVFRASALRRYAAGSGRTGPPRPAPGRTFLLLWVGLLILAVAGAVCAALILLGGG
jgi:hypothetical protein